MEVFRGRSGGAQREEGCEEDRMKQQHTSGRVAAFFDLDGTLLARPSLERRFFFELRDQRAIPVGNYFFLLGGGGGVGAARQEKNLRPAKQVFVGVSPECTGCSKGGRRP